MKYYGKELYHHGIKGQKWGERRWQYEDGSLTPEGRIHYGYGDKSIGTRKKYVEALKEANRRNVRENIISEKDEKWYNEAAKNYRHLNEKERDRFANLTDQIVSGTQYAKREHQAFSKDLKNKYKEDKKEEQARWKQQRRDYIATKSTGERIASGLLLGPVGLYTYNSLMAQNNNANKLVAGGKVLVAQTLLPGAGAILYSAIVGNDVKNKQY